MNNDDRRIVAAQVAWCNLMFAVSELRDLWLGMAYMKAMPLYGDYDYTRPNSRRYGQS